MPEISARDLFHGTFIQRAYKNKEKSEETYKMYDRAIKISLRKTGRVQKVRQPYEKDPFGWASKARRVSKS
jgi:hypothetical protein